MIETMTIHRDEVIFGALWNCCGDDAQYAGEFDTEGGGVVYHGLCDSCAHTYARTVSGGVIARIVNAPRFIVDTLRLTAPRMETTIAMDPRDVLTMLAFAEADGIDVRSVYSYGGSFRAGATHVIISVAA